MINGKTNVFGIIGDPVEHTLSPGMHNAAFKELDMNNIYVPFHVNAEELEDAIAGAYALGIKGLNITIPHKTEVIKYLDYLDIAAGLIGAVNTIEFGKNGAVGHNTDGIGAVRAINEITSVKNKKVMILGAGGAARAVAFQILLSGAKNLVISNRTIERASELRDDLVEKLEPNVLVTDLGNELERELKDTDILVNTTPIGMYPNISQKPIVTADMMHEDLVVNDIVYNPLKTGLLNEAEKAGAKPISGVKMLMYQGVESFKIWTGIEPPVEVFKKALMDQMNLEII
ncbi:shikimate dehydrogenase [Methanobacterium spitsbergense]|uniref:Shikimate dehydrogenase (NADP(+)) n=1 Tax=Methanobacterium spitsbergense TaxID=2874285 RepID=A0A8T5V319_9EURY|nr:shikimate dehydrogenase [Methanobacterium spitsbergense]MBZ2166065.1 shikimate dehydrogenase [Methanobacterium spitsbergense]